MFIYLFVMLLFQFPQLSNVLVFLSICITNFAWNVHDSFSYGLWELQSLILLPFLDKFSFVLSQEKRLIAEGD